MFGGILARFIGFGMRLFSCGCVLKFSQDCVVSGLSLLRACVVCGCCFVILAACVVCWFSVDFAGGGFNGCGC